MSQSLASGRSHMLKSQSLKTHEKKVTCMTISMVWTSVLMTILMGKKHRIFGRSSEILEKGYKKLVKFSTLVRKNLQMVKFIIEMNQS